MWKIICRVFRWTKNKKTTVNPKNKEVKCFQFAATIASNYGEIKWTPPPPLHIKKKKKKKNQILNHSNVKYNWDEIKYTSKIDSCRSLRKIAKQMFMMFYTRKNSQYNVNTIEICLDYNSKINSNCEEQIILLMILNEKKES